MKLKEFDLLSDIYYSKAYVSLYLKAGESIFSFEYREGGDKFFNIAIKRPIDKVGNVRIVDGYFDLETAYGYGGYYTTTDSQDFLCHAFDAYKQKCLDERIIAEFSRFHPYNDMPSVHGSYFNFVVPDRETVSIDLSLTKEARWSKYSATTRNILRRASAKLYFKETVDIDAFMVLYQATMEKNKADRGYYFLREYYEKLLALENVKLFAVIYENSIVNMSFVLFGQKLAHYHLSANNNEFLRLSGNYYLLDAVCDYVNANYPTISDFHLGGGRTNVPDDSLLAYKSKFSNIRKKFYIAGKIFNLPVYRQYVDLFHEQHPEHINTNYFLKYRMECL